MPQLITFRSLHLDFPKELDPLTCAGGAEESCFNVALSLLLPYLEPYLIRSMNAARPHVKDPDVSADLDKFNMQEGQHYRQHKIFNDAVRAHGYPKLEAFEAELDADYKRFTEKRSLRFNLAYAEGFEALTMNAARYTFKYGRTERFVPVVRDLFEWHLVEEMEHRTVTFDVYQAVCPGWLYRTVVGWYAQLHMMQWIFRVMLHLLDVRGVELRTPKYGGWPGAIKRLVPWFLSQTIHLWPRVLLTFLPWYSPHRIAMPAKAVELGAHYSALAARTAPALPAE